jgi:ferredoxin
MANQSSPPLYKIIIDEEKCIAAASCIGVAMNTFRLNENNKVELISPSGDEAELILLAAQSCPTLAITLYDLQSGEKVWPKD